MEAIRRDDGELCGHVAQHDGRWHALTVFGAVLEVASSRDAAAQVVLGTGLASLAERWMLVTEADPDGEVVCIVEASPAGVTVALGHYSFDGAPTRHIARSEIDAGAVTFRRLG